jgi:SSS family solute:Na+ symporter
LLISSVVLSFLFWMMANPAAIGGTGGGLLSALGLEALDLPFVIRIWIVFIACLAIGVVVSLVTGRPAEGRPVDLGGIRFATEPVFNFASLVIIAILIGIYGVFW